MRLQFDVHHWAQLELPVLVPAGQQDPEEREQHEQEQDEHPPDAPGCGRPYGHCVPASAGNCLECVSILVGR